MLRRRSRSMPLVWLAASLMLCWSAESAGQGRTAALGEGPWTFATYLDEIDIKVSVVARPLSHPWSLAFLPDGDMLVTERDGRLRLIRDGKLLPDSVAETPEVSRATLAGLMDLALHPRFEENTYIYFSYSKPIGDVVATTLARGRWTGDRLVDIEDIFIADDFGERRAGASRIQFDSESTLFVTNGGTGQEGDTRSQDPGTHVGKLLRLRDDGGIPADNPFIGVDGVRPEIYSLGHRNQLGLALHPQTDVLWASEQGPQGGDEVNIIEAGANYGWPIVTYGRNYNGTPAADRPWSEEFNAPELFWVPSIALSGMTFYTGDAFPEWQGNLFVGGLIEGRIPRTGHIERIVFNENGEIRRESLIRELHQRIRDIRQGPDGNLYVLTEETDGALLKIEPAR